MAVYATGSPGRVLRHDGSAVLVGTQNETKHYALRPSTPPLAVGDWVVVDDQRVVDLLPRASLLQRRDPSTGGSQPIAANIDIVGIVCGLDRPVPPGRIQRFTSLAWDAGASPLVILSKADLVESTVEIEGELLRHDPAADIISVSSETTDGISDLLGRCVNRTLVLVGESGAGKSTLLNALAGRELGATGAVRRGDSKGRHTTTARQLFLLEGNCCLIDTPGVREVGVHTDVDTIDDGFGDIAELAVDCHFRDCGHTNEPGCEVQAAVADGRLDDDRMRGWEQLRKEAAFAEIRDDTAARHRADRRLARIIRNAQDIKRR
ncbi:MAG: ribosome small subunit-dependent GTPase A [Actinomycetia bacterium]|nr:ribosome small subunit-dependent GTPase A [Actinomycetes bacterium]MCP4085444.1 ribosome small subunit-dependent GTPase A [Actinomycetes bacterium]